MYYAYILLSMSDESSYKGSCSVLQVRLRDHNAGKVRSTKGKRPWKLHYSEQFALKKDAIKRERFFKSRSGYRWLKERGIL